MQEEEKTCPFKMYYYLPTLIYAAETCILAKADISRLIEMI
jgi:hypothetical protein